MTTSQGGTDWELQEAEAAIVAAGTDARALAQAQHRHAEAIRNMMQGAIVPSFVALVERVLGEKIDPVAGGIAGLRGEIEEASRGIADIKKSWRELDSWRGRIEAALSEFAAFRDESTADRKQIRDAIDTMDLRHGAQIAELIERIGEIERLLEIAGDHEAGA